MKLKEYIRELNKFVQEYPEAYELPVIYSKDDEGNAYHNVIYSPAMFQVEDLTQYYLEVVGKLGDEGIAREDCNAICIN